MRIDMTRLDCHFTVGCGQEPAHDRITFMPAPMPAHLQWARGFSGVQVLPSFKIIENAALFLKVRLG